MPIRFWNRSSVLLSLTLKNEAFKTLLTTALQSLWELLHFRGTFTPESDSDEIPEEISAQSFKYITM